jgi:hypothetical protein
MSGLLVKRKHSQQSDTVVRGVRQNSSTQQVRPRQTTVRDSHGRTTIYASSTPKVLQPSPAVCFAAPASLDDCAWHFDDQSNVEADTLVGDKVAVKVRKRYESSVGIISLSIIHSLTFLQDEPILAWYPYRDEYGLELMRLDGRGDSQGEPCLCGSKDEPIYRCDECSGGRMLCKKCMVDAHRALPLHRIKVIGIFMQRLDLWLIF